MYLVLNNRLMQGRILRLGLWGPRLPGVTKGAPKKKKKERERTDRKEKRMKRKKKEKEKRKDIKVNKYKERGAIQGQI